MSYIPQNEVPNDVWYYTFSLFNYYELFPLFLVSKKFNEIAYRRIIDLIPKHIECHKEKFIETLVMRYRILLPRILLTNKLTTDNNDINSWKDLLKSLDDAVSLFERKIMLYNISADSDLFLLTAHLLYYYKYVLFMYNKLKPKEILKPNMVIMVFYDIHIDYCDLSKIKFIMHKLLYHPFDEFINDKVEKCISTVRWRTFNIINSISHMIEKYDVLFPLRAKLPNVNDKQHIDNQATKTNQLVTIKKNISLSTNKKYKQHKQHEQHEQHEQYKQKYNNVMLSKHSARRQNNTKRMF